jgi:protein-S-isoprenylcysteine O-methyltransferase Ste14
MSVAFDPSRPWFLVRFFVYRLRRDLQFSGIFLCDFFAAAAYAGASVHMLHVVQFGLCTLVAAGALLLIVIAAQALKILGVISLEKRGGDAREFIGSDTLVTDGVYAFSRNPVYLVAILQSLVWSVILLIGAMTPPGDAFLFAAAFVIPVAHFVSIDRLIIPNEESALKAAHPQAFAEYAAQVNRWIGRKTG